MHMDVSCLGSVYSLPNAALKPKRGLRCPQSNSSVVFSARVSKRINMSVVHSIDVRAAR